MFDRIKITTATAEFTAVINGEQVAGNLTILVLDKDGNAMDTPSYSLLKANTDALFALGVHTDVDSEITWSKMAGCVQCACKPGYILTQEDANVNGYLVTQVILKSLI